MSSALVKQAIRRFLEKPTPQVLCIRGKWGIGKTYVWEETFKQAKAEDTVALPYYCYVSLFSLQSIDEVRQTIFENRVTTKKIDIEPTWESMKENVAHYAEVAAKKASKLVPFTKVPYLDNYIANFSGGFRQVVSLAVRDTIICFDDFERKKISAKDLLGLISQFREEKRCKAVIIINDDALSEEERNDFNKYFEKVVDIPIEFAPTPVESADIAITASDVSSVRLKQIAITLGICNIRVINRIRDAGAQLVELLAGFGADTEYQALHTLTLFMWSKYDSEGVPKELLWKQRNRFLHFIESKERTEDEKKWFPLLEEYKFGSMDEFDVVIATGVEKGFFDEEQLLAEAKKKGETQAESVGREAIARAWKTFHGSFDANVAEVVETINAAYSTHISSASIGNLDEAVTIFRDFGYNDIASSLISTYIESKKGQIKVVDDPSHPFHPVIKDKEFRTALEAAIIPFEPRSIKEIFTDVYHGRHPAEEIEHAMKLSTEELYEFFKGLKGDELYPAIEGSLFYSGVSNVTEKQRIHRSRRYGAGENCRESALNSIRVRKFSVNVAADMTCPPRSSPPGMRLWRS